MQPSSALETIIVSSDQDPIGSVIWLHGLGADANDFTSIVPELNLPTNLPLRFIFPHAPVRPVTLNANLPMRAWYDIFGLDRLAKEDEVGIQQTMQSIHDLIKKEMAIGIKSQRIILAGFSQGGAMALFSGLHYDYPLGGILALSTYLPLSRTITKTIKAHHQEIPIFMAHGKFDTVLPLLLGKESYQILNQLGCPIEWHEYPMAHEVCTLEIRAIGNWLTQQLSKSL